MTDTLHLTIHVDQRPVTTSTVIEAAGGDGVLTITTALAELGAALQSVYIGARDLPTIVVEQLYILQHVEQTHRELDRRALPVTHARERCLLDHAACLHEHLETAGYTVCIDLGDRDLAAATVAYPPPR
ncbi:MAG: hypothetical protein ACR2NB_02255 [Solirubrobacteraceae bacterium]